MATQLTRDGKAINLMKNMGIITMTVMTVAMTEALSDMAKKMGQALGEAFVTAVKPEDAGKWRAEYEKNAKEIPVDIVSEVRSTMKDIDEQYKSDPEKFKAIISNHGFDEMLKVVAKYDVSLPKLTESMDEKALSMYVVLALAGDKTISPLFKELMELQAKMAQEMEKGQN